MFHEIEQAASYHFDPILLPAILLAVTDIIRIEEAPVLYIVVLSATF